MGQKNLAVLTSDHINEGFLTRKSMAVLLGSQKKDRNNEVVIRWGFTLLFYFVAIFKQPYSFCCPPVIEANRISILLCSANDEYLSFQMFGHI